MVHDCWPVGLEVRSFRCFHLKTQTNTLGQVAHKTLVKGSVSLDFRPPFFS